ncbi:MAG: LruC domain-containing protein [Bacteroidales bacterium]|nr:LruC domain-containing protein [Bacteroidales bacterium]
MKRYFLLISLALSFLWFSQPLLAIETQDFESGSTSIEEGNCWSFEEADIVLKSNISGSYLCQTTQLNGSTRWIKTAWINITTAGNLEFKHRLSGTSGSSRVLKVYQIGTSGSQTLIFTHNYQSGQYTTLQTESVAITETGVYQFKFEFDGSGGSSKGWLDDIDMPGSYTFDPTSNNGSGTCGWLNPVLDADNDGVADADDDYPTDPYRAYNNYYPAGGDFGTLAFEDNWPARADYDFNDLVIDYRMNTVTNSSNQVVELLSTFVLRASGASFKNGLGVQLDGISPSKISLCSGYQLSSGTYINTASSGLEANQTYANCIVFDNFQNIMQHPGTGIGINTDPSAPFVPYDTLEIALIFINNGIVASGGYVLDSEMPSSAFNFYVISKQDRGREIHLPDHQPTDLYNPEFFNTLDDDSNVVTGKYYKTENNLPWAINILQGFSYPKETEKISDAYLHFNEWAQSSGAQYSDWYEDFSGYRNPDKIY